MSDVASRLALAMLAPGYLIAGPPDWEGNPALFPGLGGVPRPVPWDAFATATAPGLHGDEVHFAVDDEGAIVAKDGTAPILLDPLADALANELGPPFVALAVRDEGDVWAAGSNKAEIVTLDDARGDELEVTRLAGVVTTRQDGADSNFRYPELEALLRGDESLLAHRFTGSTWVVELFPL